MGYKNKQNKVENLRLIIYRGSLFICCLVILFGTSWFSLTNMAQGPTATPVRVDIIMTSTMPPTQEFVIETLAPTFTPTESGLPQLTARIESGEVNLRSLPDPNEQRLGSIRPGDLYTIRGRFFSWYLIDFPNAPSGTAWVYGELVEVFGDSFAIQDIDPYLTPTSVAEAVAGETLEIVLLTPGGDETATAESRIIVISTPTPDPSSLQVTEVGILPTFTAPAEYHVRLTATPFGSQGDVNLVGAISNVANAGIPPVLPILALGLLGFLGVIVGAIRR
jgi:hypothetical protein